MTEMTEYGKKFLAKFTKENPLPLSFSQWYNSMKTCSLMWHLSYEMKYRKHIPRGELAADGIEYHETAEIGFNELAIVDGEVDMFSKVDMPKKRKEELYFLEDWMNTKLKEEGKVPDVLGMEQKIKCKPEQIHGLWIQRIGVIDMIWILPDGSYFIWDFKTGEIIEKNPDSPNLGKAKGKLAKALHQQYYYKGILNRNGLDIGGVGLIYPDDREFYRRLNDKVPRGTYNTSRLSTNSETSIEENLHKTIYKILYEEIKPEFNAYYCNEWCDYAQEDTLLCNFDSVDLSKLRPVKNLVELQMLADELQDGDDWL